VGKLKSVLDMKLQEYNESNAMMDLVLFEQVHWEGHRKHMQHKQHTPKIMMGDTKDRHSAYSMD
jgi:hypothetical protein